MKSKNLSPQNKEVVDLNYYFANFHPDYPVRFYFDPRACGLSFENEWPEQLMAKSVTHAYQAAKQIEPNDALLVLEAKDAKSAKYISKLLISRKGKKSGFYAPDGVDTVQCVQVMQPAIVAMESILEARFFTPMERMKLERTGTSRIVLSNISHDNLWGICGCGVCSSARENNTLVSLNLYGQHIEWIREDIRIKNRMANATKALPEDYDKEQPIMLDSEPEELITSYEERLRGENA